MSKFNELYGYLSDRQTPHLFVIAEVLFGIKEAIEKQNECLTRLCTSLDKLLEKQSAPASRSKDPHHEELSP